MDKQFQQIQWDQALRDEAAALLRRAVREDLGRLGDATSKALIPKRATGAAAVVARQSGILAGVPAAETAAGLVDPHLRWLPAKSDGCAIAAGERIARIEGPARSILAAERLVLNVLGRLSGIATLTRQYVDAVSGTTARIYDTRKTTPGWRRLEKYAVRLGGGHNHRSGLFDAILIKDNHLAFGKAGTGGVCFSPAEAVARARQWIKRRVPEPARRRMIVEIEVDSLDQLEEVLSASQSDATTESNMPTERDAAAGPDIVLLDNMSPDQLREAVARRNARNPSVELEASGGVTLENVRFIAESSVERISVGALTHAAHCLDFGLDWLA